MSLLTAPDRALLELIRQQGETTITELLDLDEIEAIMDAEPGASLRSRIARLRACGYLAGLKHPTSTRTAYSLSDTGLRALRMVTSVTLGAVAAPRTTHSRESYSGAELQPFTGRPGAMDAFAKPSREGGQLVPRRRPTLISSS